MGSLESKIKRQILLEDSDKYIFVCSKVKRYELGLFYLDYLTMKNRGQFYLKYLGLLIHFSIKYFNVFLYTVSSPQGTGF